MTRVKLWQDEWSAGMRVEGHAGYDSTGRDIVCAACSVLVQALASSLANVGLKQTRRQESGSFWYEISKTGKEELVTYAMGAYGMAVTGLEMLAAAYPQNVAIEK